MRMKGCTFHSLLVFFFFFLRGAINTNKNGTDFLFPCTFSRTQCFFIVIHFISHIEQEQNFFHAWLFLLLSLFITN